MKAPVAGIAVRLVTGEGDDDYIILTDIQGRTKILGDMDLAGTDKGITAIQMDIEDSWIDRTDHPRSNCKNKRSKNTYPS